MAEPGGFATGAAGSEEAVWVCRGDALAERGQAQVFEVMQYRQRVHAFVLRHEGRAVAYLNRCVHVPTEMDWQPGHFLDSDREFIICSIHGASYHAQSGRCVGGPCGRGQLTALRVEERDGQVYWYPSRDIRPAVVPKPESPP
jgi:nitrite reductase/ring-hydroxylating ferredoxin subunit